MSVLIYYVWSVVMGHSVNDHDGTGTSWSTVVFKMLLLPLSSSVCRVTQVAQLQIFIVVLISV